jgi:hypothetical protein
MATRAPKLTKQTKRAKKAVDAVEVQAKDINALADLINFTDRGTVTQATSITTAVTLNAPAGVITTVSTTVAAGSNASFTVNNNFSKADSVILLTVDDSATAGLAKVNVQTVANGSFVINITNIHSANAFNEVIKVHFQIL